MRLKRFGKYIIFSPGSLNKNCMQCGKQGNLGKDTCSHLKCLSCILSCKLSECVQCHRDQQDDSSCQIIKVIEESKSLSSKPQIGTMEEKETTSQNKMPTTIIGKEAGKKYFPAVKKISTGTGTYFEAPKYRFNSVSALQKHLQIQGKRNSTDSNLPPPAFSSSVVQPVKAQVQKKNHRRMLKSVKLSEPLFVRKLTGDLPSYRVLKRKRKVGTVDNNVQMKSSNNKREYQPEISSAMPTLEDKKKVYRPLLKCSYCARAFEFKSWLIRHMAKHQ